MGWSFHGKLLNNQMVHGNDCPPWNQHEKHENRLDFFLAKAKVTVEFNKSFVLSFYGSHESIVVWRWLCEDKDVIFLLLEFAAQDGPPYVGKLVYNGANYG